MRYRVFAVVAMIAAGDSAISAAQTGNGSVGRVDSVLTVAGGRYARGWIHRQLFGSRYRAAWASSIRVPTLDLSTFAGGLQPVKRGGGQQTRNLRFEGRDGRQYVFRSVDKDPIAAIDPTLRTELTEDLFQDQISAGHPTAPLAVAPILRAVGILHAQPLLVVMPDDERLGEFRAEFAGMLGMIEERPQDPDDGGPAFAGAVRIVDSEDLLEALDACPDVPLSARDFLAARLTDVFLGDWDRHRDQWQWALVSDSLGDRWLPLPRDRDQAFIRYDGLLLRVLRSRRPELVDFGPRYSPLVGATWNGRDLDRTFLGGLERSTWDSVARSLAGRITDSVIDAAIAALPPEHRRISGPRLGAALRTRRDGLVPMAIRYYEFLAGEVDVRGSDANEVATVDRTAPDTVVVTVRRAGGKSPSYQRRFLRSETNQIRIYLRGGSDSAIVRGPATAIDVRVVGGGGDDHFSDEGGGGRLGFYDDRGRDRSIGREIDRRRYEAIRDTTETYPVPHRDWGGSGGFFPAVSPHSNRGLLVGLGYRTTSYRFRRVPFASRTEYRAEVSVGSGSHRLRFNWLRPFENSASFVDFQAMLSGVEIDEWYGFGNDTRNDPFKPSSFYSFNPYQLSVAARIGWGLGPGLTLYTGLVGKHTTTNIDGAERAARFLAADRPFGSGRFAQLGGRVALRWIKRADSEPLTSSLQAEADVSGYPAMFDVARPFASAGGRVAVAVRAPLPLRPTVAVQVGARKIYATPGTIPFHEAAFVGGWRSLRGFRNQRFAGDAAIYGSAELRLQLLRLPMLVPARQGVFGYYDRGRVYLQSASSSTWHSGWGGGLWLAFLPSSTIVSLAAGRSREGTRLYFKTDFAY